MRKWCYEKNYTTDEVNKMKIKNVIIGTIITTIGVAIAYGEYKLISLIYDVSSWISKLLNAPESFAALLTIIISCFFLGLIIIIAVIAIYLIVI
jgi:uncharacterized protein involved in cysteine biosynthesis